MILFLEYSIIIIKLNMTSAVIFPVNRVAMIIKGKYST